MEEESCLNSRLHGLRQGNNQGKTFRPCTAIIISVIQLSMTRWLLLQCCHQTIFRKQRSSSSGKTIKIALKFLYQSTIWLFENILEVARNKIISTVTGSFPVCFISTWYFRIECLFTYERVVKEVIRLPFKEWLVSGFLWWSNPDNNGYTFFRNGWMKCLRQPRRCFHVKSAVFQWIHKTLMT